MLHQKAFWAGVFFLVGVMLMSIRGGASWLFVLFIIALCVALLLLFERYPLAVCALMMIVGAGYFQLRSFNPPAALPETPLIGSVMQVRSYPDYQQLLIRLGEGGTTVLVYADKYPTYQYGYMIRVFGELRPTQEGDTRLARDHTIGSVFADHIEILSREGGSRLFRVLYGVRDHVAGQFERVLPPSEATFLTGLLLGKSAAFTEDLRDQMRLTGTTHLVALSGSNVAIIIRGVLILFGLWFSRRALFPITVTAVVLFVLMTGAEASVVRAAIMAGIVLLAERTGRAHNTRMAIVAAAVVMVLVNPTVLVFDIGFQLSFFALLGIVYVQPVFESLVHLERLQSRLLIVAIRLVLATLAAQVAVFPLSLYHFGYVSLLAVIPNTLILIFIPLTMFLGFLVVLFGLFSQWLAILVAYLAHLFLAYELSVISFFARFSVGVETSDFPLIAMVAYYLLLSIFVVRMVYQKRVMIE